MLYNFFTDFSAQNVPSAHGMLLILQPVLFFLETAHNNRSQNF